MAAEPRTAQPLLARFWTLQLLGWGGFYIAYAFSRLGRYPLTYMLASKVVLVALGVLASLGLRAIVRPLLARQARMLTVVTACVAGSYVLGILWTGAFNALVVPLDRALLGDASGIESLGELFNGSVYHAFALVAWGFLYLGIKHHSAWQLERERALRAEAMAADARLRALQYQLNPHFFFNTLNAISTLVVERRNEEAAAMIARLGELLRATLHRDVATRVSLADELGFVQRYLDIEQIRFGDRLRVQLDIDEDAYRAQVPLLILQPLVENAIRHGIARRPDGGTLSIVARPIMDGETRWLEIAIENSRSAPVGSPSADRRGIGLTNVRERLMRLYGDRHRCIAESVQGDRFRVELRLPFVVVDSTVTLPVVEREPAQV
jgi:two-component sensor histidine kinase